jgi:hypothetical protein
LRAGNQLLCVDAGMAIRSPHSCLANISNLLTAPQRRIEKPLMVAGTALEWSALGSTNGAIDMDTHEELRELDIAEIDTVSGGRLPAVVQGIIDKIACEVHGGDYTPITGGSVCSGPATFP